MRKRGFAAAWRFYADNFRAVFVLSLLFYVAIAALAVLSALELGFVLAIFAIFYLALASVFWLQAPLARLMDDVRAARPNVGARQTLTELGPRMGSITGGSLLASAGVYAGMCVLVLPGVFLLARWALLIPVITIEHKGTFRAFARSNRLVKGHTWRVVAELVGSGLLLIAIWTIGLTLLLAGSVAGIVLTLLFLALAMPLIPLMRNLSYYDLLEISAERRDGVEAPAPPVTG